MLQEDGFAFLNHFLTVASSYNHIDLKDSIKCPYKYRAHFEAMLSSELEQWTDEKNLPFILGVACLLGG